MRAKGFIPLYLLPNGSVVCGPAVHSTEQCARESQPIITPFQIVPIDIDASDDAPRVDGEDWIEVTRCGALSSTIGFMSFQAKPKHERKPREVA